jgi:CRP-like cAMP-binding protein
MDAQVLPPQDWRGNRFLQGIAPDLVERLATLLTRTEHAAGEFILREGEASDRICLLASGSVQVRKGDGAALGEVAAGGYFGEMGVLSGAPRSSSVVASEPVVLWSLTVDALRALQADTGTDLLALSARAQVGVLGERLASTSEVAAQSMRERMEEFRMRVAFGNLFSNVILMLFVYISALGLLRQFAASAGSSTITTSVLLLAMAAGAAWIARASGFPAATFGFTMRRWPWAVADSLSWTLLFCTAITLAKAALLQWGPGYAHLRLFKPWVSPDGLGATLLAYALYTVLTPVQEFIARGMLQGSLHKMLTGRHVALRAILVANAIFSLSHQHLGLGYALAVFVPGLFWGWLYHRQRSLLGVSLSHVLIGLWGTGVLDLASVVQG